MRPGAAAAAIALLAVAGCTGTADNATPSSSGPALVPEGPAAPLPAALLEPLVAQVPELSLAPLPEMRLAEGLTPPTNRWFSGLVFGAEPQPVFPLPLAFSIDDTSFGAGLPQVVTSATNIVGSHQQDINVEVAQAATTVVSAYDVASVTLETRDDEGQPLGRTTVAQGSPFVSHVAMQEETLTTSVAFTGSTDVVVADTPTGSWAIRLEGAELAGNTITFAEGDSMVLFPVPADGSLEETAAFAVPLSGTTVSYSVRGDEVTTELTYETRGADTAYGGLPHQASALSDACDLGTFPTVYGTLTLCPGSTSAWSVPRQPRSPRSTSPPSPTTTAPSWLTRSRRTSRPCRIHRRTPTSAPSGRTGPRS